MTEIEKIKEEKNIVDVVSGYVALEKKGSEFYGICPFHDDNKSSLQVNDKKQIFKCFACGEGGDMIDFVEKIENVDTAGAIKIFNGSKDSAPKPIKKTSKKPKTAKKTWKHVTETDLAPESFTHYKWGEPVKYWAYRNENGTIYGYAVRFETNEGKMVLPYVYATDGKIFEWRFLGFETPRKLYNADLIANNPDAVIILVEGEKTADAGQNEVNAKTTVFTTWIGGANSIKNVDFTPLKNRKVILIPDHDTEQKDRNGNIKPWNEQPGNLAMLNISEIIKDSVNKLKWVSVPESYPHKWDIADKDWKKSELNGFIKENLVDVPKIEVEKPKPKTTPAPPKKKQIHFDNDFFRLLGYDKDENSRLVYFFFSFEAKTVIKLSPSNMNKSNLLMLAPMNYWEDNFSGNKTKVDIDAVQNYLTQLSHKIGIFKDKYIRGRGAWVDNNEIVIHTGENIIRQKTEIPLRSFKSNYVYEIGENLGYGTKNPLPTKKAHRLIEFMDFLSWEREINAYLLAGWCVIAPFCGVLNWRPHIWITGPAGSGKSWIMENIVKQLMSETAVVVQGKTTEAGVRGLLQSDARPVLFDESDVDSQNDKERIQSILALARASSYSDGGGVVKGTQTGTSRTYQIRSCFAFSSIGVQLNQQADRSRFTTLGLVSNDGIQTKDQFKKFMIQWMNEITDSWVEDFQARTLELMPTIIENTKTFSDAAAHVIGNKRMGDQVGSMLAGAYSLSSSKTISLEDAIAWVESKDWSEEKGLELTKDEWQLWNVLTSHIIKVEGDYGLKERNIGELLKLSGNYDTDLAVTVGNADKALRRVGIMVNGDSILVSNTSPEIKKIVRNSAWGNNHNKILERLPGAEKENPRTFYPGHAARCVKLPIKMILENGDTKNLTGSPIEDKEDKIEELPF